MKKSHFWNKYKFENVDGIIDTNDPLIKTDNKNFIVELASINDYVCIYLFMKYNYPILYDEIYFMNFLKSEHNLVLKLKHNNNIIGIITGKLCNLNIGKSYIINHLCIKKEYRNMDLCTILISKISRIIFEKKIYHSIFSCENQIFNLKSFSIKSNYIFVINKIKLNSKTICLSQKDKKFNYKLLNKIISKKYSINLYDRNCLDDIHKENIIKNYKKECKNKNLYLKFESFEDLDFEFKDCILLFDNQYNFIYLSFNTIKDIRRCFASIFYIDHFTFINKVIYHLNINNVCDILQFNIKEDEKLMKYFIKLESELYYYFYNYNMTCEVHDNIYIT